MSGRCTDLDTANRRYATLTTNADHFEVWAVGEAERLEKEAAALLERAEGVRASLAAFRTIRQNPARS